MSLGISTACFYPEKTEIAIEYLANAGIQTIEIFFNSPSEFSPKSIANIAKIISKNGMIVSSIHPYCSCFEPFLLFSNYRRRFEDGIDMYRQFFEAGQQLGAKIFILHGDKCDGKIEENDYFDRFAILSKNAEEFSLTLAQENVFNHRSQSTDFIIRMRKYLCERAKFVLDIKQSIRSGYSPYQMADAMAKDIVHVHISDHMACNSCLLPGLGEFDFAHFLSYSNSIKNSDHIIEVYSDAYNENDELFSAVNAFLPKYLNKKDDILFEK